MFKNKERKPFGKLTREQKLTLFGYWLDKGRIGSSNLEKGPGWIVSKKDGAWPHWHEGVVYYVPGTKTEINWEYINENYIAYARDKKGADYFYQAIPYALRDYWNSDEDIDVITTELFSNKVINKGDEDWNDSLIIRPGHEDKQ